MWAARFAARARAAPSTAATGVCLCVCRAVITRARLFVVRLALLCMGAGCVLLVVAHRLMSCSAACGTAFRARNVIALACACSQAGIPVSAGTVRCVYHERPPPPRRRRRRGQQPRDQQVCSSARLPRVWATRAHAAGAPAEATAYVINGTETNIASGNGIRCIRWLKKNENCT